MSQQVRMRRFVSPAIILLACAQGGASHASDRYTLTDLGTLGGKYSFVNGLSPTGIVTGYSSVAGETADYAFVWENGVMTNIGSLGGTSSAAYGANAAGDVVGYSYDAGNAEPHAFLYRNGVMQDLGAPGGMTSMAFGVNESGVVTGFLTVSPDFSAQAFRYDGTMVQLGVLGSGQGINSSGVIAGYGKFPSGEQAFSATGATVTPLGTPNGAFSAQSYAYAISESGEIAGWANANPVGTSSQALYSKNGALFTVGLLDAPYNGSNFGWGINSQGLVVGNANRPDGAANVAFLFDGQMHDLNTLTRGPLASYVTLSQATAINDQGLIVSNGIDSRTQANHGYLLTPVKPLTLTCPLAAAMQGRAYASALLAAGGVPPYTYSVTGALPAGLALNSASGVISGTPTVSGTFTLLFSVADAPDSLQVTDTQSCPLVIQAAFAQGKLAVYPKEVDFGRVKVGEEGVLRFVAVFNNSEIAVSFKSIRMEQSASSANRFEEKSFCPKRLPAHRACAVLIRLHARREGKLSGSLVIASDASDGHLSVPVTATIKSEEH